jgi:endoglucanase
LHKPIEGLLRVNHISGSGMETDLISDVNGGIPGAMIPPALRYLHSVVEMADPRDVPKTIELIQRVVGSVADDDDFAHKL